MNPSKTYLFLFVVACSIVLATSSVSPPHASAQNLKDEITVHRGTLVALETTNLLNYHTTATSGAGHKYLVTYDAGEDLLVINVKWAGGLTWSSRTAKPFVEFVAKLLKELNVEYRYKIVAKTNDGVTHVYRDGRFE